MRGLRGEEGSEGGGQLLEALDTCLIETGDSRRVLSVESKETSGTTFLNSITSDGKSPGEEVKRPATWS